MSIFLRCMALLKLLFALGLLLFSLNSLAEIDVVEFADPAQAAQYQRLINELRCPKCQNNNIADSNAPLARDLRAIVYEKVQAGESDEAIRDFMTERYGDFILYRPPFKPSTWALWLGPLALLLGVGILLWRWLKRQSHQSPAALSDAELAQLQILLQADAVTTGLPANPLAPKPDRPAATQEPRS